jgi:hypothetical protein
MSDDSILTPGEVIDGDDLDSKLVRLRLSGPPHFTGLEMIAVEAHFGKDMTELSAIQMQIAAGWCYLRRVKGDAVTWAMVENQVVVEIEDRPNPTEPANSATSPSSATSGE